jgi:hypothetical protein
MITVKRVIVMAYTASLAGDVSYQAAHVVVTSK